MSTCSAKWHALTIGKGLAMETNDLSFNVTHSVHALTIGKGVAMGDERSPFRGHALWPRPAMTQSVPPLCPLVMPGVPLLGSRFKSRWLSAIHFGRDWF